MPGGARALCAVGRALRLNRGAKPMTFDPRTTPARPDLAARHLEGQVTAARFVDGTLREVIEAQAPLRRAPAPDAPLDTEALKGERVTVYESNEEGWSWGQLASDGYVGWLPTAALAAPGPAPTHRVAAPRTGWCFRGLRSGCRRWRRSRSARGLRSRASTARSR